MFESFAHGQGELTCTVRASFVQRMPNTPSKIVPSAERMQG